FVLRVVKKGIPRCPQGMKTGRHRERAEWFQTAPFVKSGTQGHRFFFDFYKLNFTPAANTSCPPFIMTYFSSAKGRTLLPMSKLAPAPRFRPTCPSLTENPPLLTLMLE